MTAAVPALSVAEHILYLDAANSEQAEEPSDLSNLKLQKLLYYAQGFFLAEYNKALFSDPIVAWMHGPVVSAVYHEYKKFGKGPIDVVVVEPRFAEASKQGKLLEEIYDSFGQYSAWKLRQMTHAEPPWKETDPSEVISHEKLRKYFLTQFV